MHNTFTIKEALSFGWKKMSENFWFLILLTLGFIVVSALLDKSGDPRTAMDVLSQILNMILSTFAMFTFVRIGLKIYHGHKPTWNDVVEFDVNSFFTYLVASVIFAIAYVAGFVLLIIPGIIAIIRLGFFGFALLDHEHNKMAPIPSLKKSIELTRGHFWHLLGLGFVLGAINLVGALAFGVGLLITSPFSLLATVYVYQKLKTAPHHVVHHTPAA